MIQTRKHSAKLSACTGSVALAVICMATVPAPAAVSAELEAVAQEDSRVDALVFAQLKKLGITASKPCTDDVFVRRAYLDIIGTLPTAREAGEFLASRDPAKRSALIDRLLQRDEFADYWAMKWSDLLRIKAEFPINLWPNAAQAYHRWVRTALHDNQPYDQFVRELLTASGSNFRVPQVNFYRAMQSREPPAIAQAVALNFMGTRAEKWPRERMAGMAAFFSWVGYKQTSEWKEEIVYFDPAATNGVSSGTLPDGKSIRFADGVDPRQLFADWLVDPGNPWFARGIANRVWSWFVGRGIVREPDDFRADNPPVNPELLACLERELVEHHYDLRHLYRIILNSRTYQLSSVPADDRPEAETHFARYPLRRLDAEVLADALNQITGTTEQYTSSIPEPFTFIPEDQRSIALPDGSISSAFLELFGKPARDTGLEAERNNRPTAAQSLHLLNSSHIQRKLEQSPRLQTLMQSKAAPRDVISGLYLMILSRYPTEEELKLVRAHSQSGSVKEREAMNDLAWALINSAEFLYRH